MTETRPEGLALLRAVAEEPDDDTARLVYADWLDERDDSTPDQRARARLIRTQIELGHAPSGPRRRRLLREQTALVKRHGRAWVCGAPVCAHPTGKTGFCERCLSSGEEGGLADAAVDASPVLVGDPGVSFVRGMTCVWWSAGASWEYPTSAADGSRPIASIELLLRHHPDVVSICDAACVEPTPGGGGLIRCYGTPPGVRGRLRPPSRPEIGDALIPYNDYTGALADLGRATCLWARDRLKKKGVLK